MAESQVSPEAVAVNATVHGLAGYVEISEYSASVRAFANLVGDAAMSGGMVRNVAQDFSVLFNSLGLRGRSICDTAKEYDTIPDGIEVAEHTGHTLTLLSEALTLRESVDEDETWGLSHTLTMLAQGIDTWARGWYGVDLSDAEITRVARTLTGKSAKAAKEAGLSGAEQ